MKKHIVYLATDANRAYIEADYCSDIIHRFLEFQQSINSPFAIKAKVSRIVYTEEFQTFEAAQKRKLELNMYTHMMKERIIRKGNPNWLNIIPSINTSNKKVVVYA